MGVLIAQYSSTGNESPLILLAGIALGVTGIVHGVRTWRGEELGFVVEHQRTYGPMTNPVFWLGGRRLYKTMAGAGLGSLLTGIWFVGIGIVELLRQVLRQPPDWWLMYIVGWGGAVLFGVPGGFYLLFYFWTGVPDWLRPPSQRGWKLTKNGYELVRPEAVPPSER